MKQRALKYLFASVIVCLLSLQLSFGQDYGRMNSGVREGLNKPLVGVPDYNNENENQDTTTKPPRIRKPLESWYFDDSIRKARIFAWNVSMKNNDIRRVVVDTLLEGFHVDYGFQRKGVGSAWLGNVGSASTPLNYFERPNPMNFSMTSVWDPFLMTPERVVFYNAKSPYSRLSYEMSGQDKIEENLFNFILSHNISPSTSANFVYNADGTKGLYKGQKTLARYFAVNLAHTGKRYAIHGGYIYNHGNITENGGVVSDNDIIDTIFPQPDNIPVRLEKASNTYRSHTFWATQSYGMPLRKQREDELTIQKIPTIYFGQSTEYSIYKKNYTAIGDTSLFKTSYYSDDFSDDSLAQTMLDLKAFVQIQPYNRNGVLGLVTAGIGNQSNTYFHDTVPGEYRDRFGAGGQFSKNSTYVYGSLDGSLKEYLKWGAGLQYFFAGYRSQDLQLDGNLRLAGSILNTPLSLEGNVMFSLREPDFWTQQYFSNHFAWSNSFEKEVSTVINARFSMPSIGLELGGDYAILQNKVYYDENSLPAQSGAAVNVMGLYLQKNFLLGGFHLNHRVLMQWSTDQKVVPVPSFSAYLSYFLRVNVVKNVLAMDMGLDARYNTSYYGFGYNPAIAQFYNQREKEIGGYPYLDAFVSAKWKRMRMLVKLSHFNANLLGKQDYFMVLHYPANRMMLKIGISWSFYD